MCRSVARRRLRSVAVSAVPRTWTRAKPGRPSVIRTVAGGPPSTAIVVDSAHDSSSITFGGRAATPWLASVRRKSTGSPPAPTSASWRLLTLGPPPLPRRDGERFAGRRTEREDDAAGLLGEGRSRHRRIPDVHG